MQQDPVLGFTFCHYRQTLLVRYGQWWQAMVLVLQVLHAYLSLVYLSQTLFSTLLLA